MIRRAHAEIEALRAGGQVLGSYRLTDTTLYVLWSHVRCVPRRSYMRAFGASYSERGILAQELPGSIVDVFKLPGSNHRVDVFGGVLADECGRRLKEFFARRRGGG